MLEVERNSIEFLKDPILGSNPIHYDLETRGGRTSIVEGGKKVDERKMCMRKEMSHDCAWLGVGRDRRVGEADSLPLGAWAGQLATL